MLSIIIPAHNEEKYLADTIASIRAQKFTGYEIIVVDDGSSDRTLEVARKLKVRTVRCANRKGAAVARNAGAKIAKGDYYMFLDADVHLTEGCLQQIASERVALGTCKALPSNKTLRHRLMMFLKNIFLCPLGVSNGVILCTKEVFVSRKGFATLHQGEDGEFIRSLKKTHGFQILSRPVIVSTRRFDKTSYLRLAWHWLTITQAERKQKYSVVR